MFQDHKASLPIAPGKPRPTLVAQEAAPVGLTVALPGLRAAPMNAAWEEDALVTQRARPAVVAPGRGRDGDTQSAVGTWNPKYSLGQD